MKTDGKLRFKMETGRATLHCLSQTCSSYECKAVTIRRLEPRKGEWHFAFIAGNDSIGSMATLTIRQLDEKTKTRLRVRAARHGRSMEEEAREILRSVLEVSRSPKFNLAEAIHRRFAVFGGVEVELPGRDAMRQTPDLTK